MDNSHVAFIAVKLDKSTFETYHCDHALSLGVNLNSLSKVLRYSKNDDTCGLKVLDGTDALLLTLETNGMSLVQPPALSFLPNHAPFRSVRRSSSADEC